MHSQFLRQKSIGAMQKRGVIVLRDNSSANSTLSDSTAHIHLLQFSELTVHMIYQKGSL